MSVFHVPSSFEFDGSFKSVGESMNDQSGAPGFSKRVFDAVARFPAIRAPLFRAYDWALRRNRAHLRFDQDLGIDTRGFLPNHALQSGKGKAIEGANVGYGSIMPSVLRKAIEQIPDIANSHFIDLGAGKGRALAVASEYPFASITGIELNPSLCAICRKHAAAIAAKHPKRTPIRMVEGDASAPELPSSGQVVAYIYNSFGTELMRRLADNVGKARSGFFISVNPVQGHVFDAHPNYKRYFAETVPYTKEELLVAPDEDDGVVIWSIAETGMIRALPNADRQIRVIKDNWRCELV